MKDYTTEELKTLARVLQLFGQAQDMRFRAHWDTQLMFVTVPTSQIQFIALERSECEMLERAMAEPEPKPETPAGTDPSGYGPNGPPLTA